MLDQSVKYSSLIALLSYYIEAGTEAASGSDNLKLALTCAGNLVLYLKLYYIDLIVELMIRIYKMHL